MMGDALRFSLNLDNKFFFFFPVQINFKIVSHIIIIIIIIFNHYFILKLEVSSIDQNYLSN
jgi:hypothetical protein